MLSFKPAFSLSFLASSKDSLVPLHFLPLGWYHLHIWGYWYISQQAWFQLELHPAHFIQAFHIMYCANKLNKNSDNIQPWGTLFPIWNQSVVPCSVLTVASCPAYRFLRRQVRWSGIPISLKFSQYVVIQIVKGFSIIVNEAEVDVFLELFAFSKVRRMFAIWSLVHLPFLFFLFFLNFTLLLFF